MNKRIYVNPSVKLVSSTIGYIGFFLWLKSRQQIITDLTGDHFMKSSELTDDWYDKLPSSFIVGDETVTKEEYYHRIDAMNLQYNNSEYMVFEINGSCLFRDILFNINKIAQWAESNRFLFSILGEDARFESENYKISSEYKDIPEWEDQFDIYMDTIRKDPIVDHNRLQMPYSISSKFWIGINRITLVNILSFLKYYAPFFYEVYGHLLMAESDVEKCMLSNKISPSIKQYIRTSNSKVDEYKEGVTNINGFTMVTSKMSLILYSQFIRQTDCIISGLYNELLHKETSIEDFKHKVFKGNTTFMITYVAHESKAIQTVTNRLCAFAMSSGHGADSWNYFLKNFIPHNISLDEFIRLLPCKFNKSQTRLRLVNCKFHDDIKFRNEGKEISNCPCPLVTQSIKDAISKKERDGNQIGDLYYSLTNKLVNDGLTKTLSEHIWTSDLEIYSLKPIDKQLISELKDYANRIERYFGNWNKLPIDIMNKLSYYTEYGLNGDLTCMMKGFFIDYLISELFKYNYSKFLINFGGDIFGYNTFTTVSIDGSNLKLSLEGNFSVFTSGNNLKRGNHIVGGGTGQSVTVVNWLISYFNNTAVDILSTKHFAKEFDSCNELSKKIRGKIAHIDLDINGTVINKCYCASPFFDEDQIKTRDNMILLFSDVFRPDLTESSKLYDQGDDSKVEEVVNDNLLGINDSDFLVFPNHTTDLGTLFEVGYAIAKDKPIIRFNGSTWVMSFVDKVLDLIKSDDSYLFDCSKKSNVISMGYASVYLNSNQIYYCLNGCKDNIMLSTKFNHIELNHETGKYDSVLRSSSERDS